MKQLKWVAFPGVWRIGKKARRFGEEFDGPHTEVVYRECLAAQGFSTEARVSPSSEVGLSLAAGGKAFGRSEMIRVKVYVTLKKGVLDPQGETVKGALEALGFTGVKDVRIGKFLVITLNSMSFEEAKRQIEEMCRKLLANPVIEDYRFEIEEA